MQNTTCQRGYATDTVILLILDASLNVRVLTSTVRRSRYKQNGFARNANMRAVTVQRGMSIHQYVSYIARTVTLIRPMGKTIPCCPFIRDASLLRGPVCTDYYIKNVSLGSVSFKLYGVQLERT